MRSSVNQTLFNNKVPRVVYIHCNRHNLNLVLMEIAKNVQEVIFFENLLQDLYCFISGSLIHSKCIDFQKNKFFY